MFSYDGKFWSYKDVAIWPRPVQQPHPPVWIPVTSSKESIEWAARHNIPITPGAGSIGMQEDVVRYYRQCLEQHGHQLTPEHIIYPITAYIADSKAQALQEMGPYYLYFNRTLFSHGNITEAELQREAGYLSPTAHDYLRPENLAAAARGREDYRGLTMERLERQVESMPWGPPDEVRDRILDAAQHLGAGTVLVSLNRGAMPNEMFVEQIGRFAAEVMPALQAHDVASAAAPA